MRDPTAMTEPLTIGQKIVAAWDLDMIAEPCELAKAIDDAIAAERERCAAIVHAHQVKFCSDACGWALDEINSGAAHSSDDVQKRWSGPAMRAAESFEKWWQSVKLGGFMNDEIEPRHVRQAFDLGRAVERDDCHQLARSFALEPGDFDAATAETIAASIATRALAERRSQNDD